MHSGHLFLALLQKNETGEERGEKKVFSFSSKKQKLASQVLFYISQRGREKRGEKDKLGVRWGGLLFSATVQLNIERTISLSWPCTYVTVWWPSFLFCTETFFSSSSYFISARPRGIFYRVTNETRGKEAPKRNRTLSYVFALQRWINSPRVRTHKRVVLPAYSFEFNFVLFATVRFL